MGLMTPVRTSTQPLALPQKLFGARRDDYTASECRCEIPVPIQTNAYGSGEPARYACTECGERLNGDSNDAPFRRWPGDLVSGAVADAKFARDEWARLRSLVQQIPLFEQRKLRGLSGERWLVAARKAVGRTIASYRERAMVPAQDTKPQRRRPHSEEAR